MIFAISRPACGTLLLAMLLCSVLAGGCAPGGPEVLKVTGKVTYQGQPVAGLAITFLPTKGRPSRAITGADGSYVLRYDAQREGAVRGVAVTVNAAFISAWFAEDEGWPSLGCRPKWPEKLLTVLDHE